MTADSPSTGVQELLVQVLPDGKLNRQNAALFLGRTPKTLAEWHRLGIGPRSFLIGGRRFYWLDELKPYACGEKSIRP
ncbi:MAG: DNA-binding protein [Novosphingobium sp.]|uniref:DNA-binding protein n=1 Tax=Novosphingobium sp. TaxID=1874826 RepID=UPI003B992EBC